MELTAKTLHEVTFGAKVRGYDPAEVDDFIAAVAEGLDELQERLRRAVERANRAEQQLASAGSAPAEAAPVAAVPANAGAGEISKVWERAAAAAEAAMEEAKSEALSLLEEARTEAHQERSTAKAESEQMVRKARDEADRIAAEAQGQLRAEISQLESAREQLKDDVDKLAGYLDEERERVRAALSRALVALDENAANGVPPEVVAVDVPAAPEPEPQSDWRPSDRDERHDGGEDRNDSEGSSDTDGYGGSAPAGSSEDWNADDRGQSSEPEQAWHGQEGRTDEPQQRDHESSHQRTESHQEQDADPFLAELRRAVQDDGPLGPRDEDGDENDSIDHLYSEDDDDRSGFFRRKK